VFLFNLFIKTVVFVVNKKRESDIDVAYIVGKREFVSTARASQFIQRMQMTAAGHGGRHVSSGASLASTWEQARRPDRTDIKPQTHPPTRLALLQLSIATDIKTAAGRQVSRWIMRSGRKMTPSWRYFTRESAGRHWLLLGEWDY